MDWITHFLNRPYVNLAQFEAETLSEVERKRTAYSIAQFQRGESSEARNYLEKSRLFSREVGDTTFYREAALFVKEENFHSHLLGCFMAQMGIETAAESWSDNVFRWVRSLGDIAWSSRVLVTAELLAQVYYPALHEATESAMLMAICERIIVDEAYHIRFQMERIVRVLRQRSRIMRWAQGIMGALLFLGTTIVVWFEHRPVLSHSMTFTRYVDESLRRYLHAMNQLTQGVRGEIQREQLLTR